jgi:alpha-glucosidase
MPLPPRWSLGYRSAGTATTRVEGALDRRHLPQRRSRPTCCGSTSTAEGYNPFTWDKERFPDPARMMPTWKAGLPRHHHRRPAPKAQKGGPYTGMAGDHREEPDGSVYTAPVYAGGEEPGPSAFPDSKPATRDWWGLYLLTDVGVAGIWNDMNEPAVFETWGTPCRWTSGTTARPAHRPRRSTTSTAC